MNEVQRLQYLDAMGLDSYLPRRVLPGALPSVLCPWPAEVPVFADEQPVVATPAARHTAASGAAVDKQVMSRLQQDLQGPARKQPATKTPVAPPPTATPPAPVSVQQFQLALFQPAAALMVLVPAQHLESRHLQLLKNILLAIQIKVDALVPVDNFIWPPRLQAGTKTMDSSISAARETLHALLEGHQLKSGLRQVLVFGGELATQLFPPEELKPLQVFPLPDLQHMLEDGEQKKITWQQIRVLKQ